MKEATVISVGIPYKISRHGGRTGVGNRCNRTGTPCDKYIRAHDPPATRCLGITIFQIYSYDGKVLGYINAQKK